MRKISAVFLVFIIAHAAHIGLWAQESAPTSSLSAHKLTLGQTRGPAVNESGRGFMGERFTQALGASYSNWTPHNTTLLKAGEGWGISYLMGYNTIYNLELSYDQIQAKTKSTGEMAEGDITLQPIGLTLQYSPRINKVIQPFISVGGSYYLFNLTTDDYEKQAWENIGIEFKQKIEDTFGYQYGLGIRIFPIPNTVDICVGYKITRILTLAKKTLSIPGASIDLYSPVDLSGEMATASILYHF